MMAGRYAHATQFNRHRVDSCAFYAPALAGSFVTSGARSQATRNSRRYSPGHSHVPIRSARSSSASAAGSSIPSTLRRWSASTGARPARLTNSVRRHHQCTGHRVANLFCTPGRCPAILMTATRWAPSSKPLRGSPAARSSVPRCPDPRRVFISGQKRGVFGRIKRELTRRSAIEAVIGHMSGLPAIAAIGAILRQCR
jgi:hypothetical protein